MSFQRSPMTHIALLFFCGAFLPQPSDGSCTLLCTHIREDTKVIRAETVHMQEEITSISDMLARMLSPSPPSSPHPPLPPPHPALPPDPPVAPSPPRPSMSATVGSQEALGFLMFLVFLLCLAAGSGALSDGRSGVALV